MQVLKANPSAGSIYECPQSPKKIVKFHDWLLNEGDISDSSMSFTVDLVCRNCGRQESFYGAIMDWKQHERWKSGEVPGEPAKEDE